VSSFIITEAAELLKYVRQLIPMDLKLRKLNLLDKQRFFFENLTAINALESVGGYK
jgi:hypothetical protein